jgi:hypothetical protein
MAAELHPRHQDKLLTRSRPAVSLTVFQTGYHDENKDSTDGMHPVHPDGSFTGADLSAIKG